jgi:hypothetical protein
VIRPSILRLSTATEVICMMARWLPCDSKMLKPVLRTRSCHSCSVQVFCVRLSARAGDAAVDAARGAVALPEPATRKTACPPLITASVVTVSRSSDCVLLERLDVLLAVLNLDCGISHDGSFQETIEKLQPSLGVSVMALAGVSFRSRRPPFWGLATGALFVACGSAPFDQRVPLKNRYAAFPLMRLPFLSMSRSCSARRSGCVSSSCLPASLL